MSQGSSHLSNLATLVTLLFKLLDSVLICGQGATKGQLYFLSFTEETSD